MKQFKIASFLLIMGTFLIACEEETIGLTDASETTVTKTEGPGPMYNSTKFYYSPESLLCGDLPTEGFDNARETEYPFFRYLNQWTDNDVFFGGDILPGVAFENWDSDNVFYIADRPSDDYILFTADSDYLDKSTSSAKINNHDEINIIFDNGMTSKGAESSYEPVYDVNMMLYTDLNGYYDYEMKSTYDSDAIENYYDDIGITVYNDYGQQIGYTGVDVYYNGTYIAIKTNEPIGRIHLEGDDDFPAIGSISFGDCQDFDNDGCKNDEDAYPNSNLSETIYIGRNHYNIDNVFVDCGSTMQDQIDQLINEINDSYYGDHNKSDSDYEDNWEELHKAFTTKLAHITYYWRINKLITAGERAEISSDAWSADIPNMGPV